MSQDGDYGAWHLRYKRAVDEYEKAAFMPELLDALAAGLCEWASLLPQTEQDRHGRHKPVNSWGLGPERSAICTLQALLHLQGHVRLATQLHRLLQRLLRTATHLDECYPKVSPDEQAAEERLVTTCRIQAKGLATVLTRLKKPLFGADSPENRPVERLSQPRMPKASPARKRASRAADIETLRKEIIEHIKGTNDAIETAVRLRCPPPAFSPLTHAALSERTGLPAHTISRCLADSTAHELRTLWGIANDPESILKYRRTH